jgi:glutamate carboxypeptidase
VPALSLADFQPLENELLDVLQSLVEIESPTEDKAAVDRVGKLAGDLMRQRGGTVESRPQAEAGDHWIGRWGGGERGILLMCHLDTVHPLGTLARFPWRVDGRRLFGPGVMDMKGGRALALTAIDALRRAGALPPGGITLLCTSDEEAGSRTSRDLIESLAGVHDLVLCLEPALPDGSVKTWRKGIGDFFVKVHGRAAHAGVEPQKGVNAILEAARQLEHIQAFQDLEAGTTITPGVIHGGTYANVVPEYCQVEIDVRVKTRVEEARIQAAFEGLSPILPGARLDLGGGWNRPPMERTPIIQATFEKVRAIAAELGIDLTEGGTGGGSDANFVAPLGVPVLDGLGPVGADAHTTQESLDLDSLAPRAALLAAILTDWPAAN